MESIIDTYINKFNEYPNGKISFDCEIGTLTFIHDSSNTLILFEIYVKMEYRNQGNCKTTIDNLINKSILNNMKFRVVCVISKILYNFLKKYKSIYGKFLIKGDGFEFVTFSKKYIN